MAGPALASKTSFGSLSGGEGGAAQSADVFSVGDAVLVGPSQAQATIRWKGAADFATGEWLGVELLEATGKNDGSVQGRRYFQCPPKHGLFVRPNQATKVQGADVTENQHAASLEQKVASAGRVAVDASTQQRRASDGNKYASRPSLSPQALRTQSLLAEAVEEHDAEKIRDLLPLAQEQGVGISELERALRMLTFEAQVHLVGELADVRAEVARLANAVEAAEARAAAAEMRASEREANHGKVAKTHSHAAAPAVDVAGAVREAWLERFGGALEQRVWEGLERRIAAAVEGAAAAATEQLVRATAELQVLWKDLEATPMTIVWEDPEAPARGAARAAAEEVVGQEEEEDQKVEALLVADAPVCFAAAPQELPAPAGKEAQAEEHLEAKAAEPASATPEPSLGAPRADRRGSAASDCSEDPEEDPLLAARDLLVAAHREGRLDAALQAVVLANLEETFESIQQMHDDIQLAADVAHRRHFEGAATKIQAATRGHQVRKSMPMGATPSQAARAETGEAAGAAAAQESAAEKTESPKVPTPRTTPRTTPRGSGPLAPAGPEGAALVLLPPSAGPPPELDLAAALGEKRESKKVTTPRGQTTPRGTAGGTPAADPAALKAP